MLSKKNRVNKKDIDILFKTGKSVFSPNLTFKFLITLKNERKISFIAPKSVAKSAVDRNRLRRLGYFVLKSYLNNYPVGVVGVFIFKKYQDNVSIIENEIKNILNKIN